MDPFEVRLQFLSLLRRLNATQQSIQKIVGYALKYFSRCGEDLWECIVEECQKGQLNDRINILYLIDNLCESSHLFQSHSQSTSYLQYVARDLDKIIQLVVPDTRDGLMNLMSTRQILESWRSKRVLDSTVVDDMVQTLDRRKESLQNMQSSMMDVSHAAPTAPSNFSKDDIVKRIEEDRERHKLLRQKRWCVPVPVASSGGPGHSHPYFSIPRLASTLPHPLLAQPTQPQSNHPSTSISSTHLVNQAIPPTPQEHALEIEFENAWETTSDWNEDDEEAAIEEAELCIRAKERSGSGTIPFAEL
ncbi:hypothetical protein BOTBODRAFT_27576 [Botryobasidium botryosum FD-172 SS1]|uniref:CID domain-containing protein n=1 Tax=Botryobasidium botryosum (strain FD-172 SS1) TaxID=930990 RepID=A0A067MX24_BOTB1|nr:hypothetical protein BOTBODRAFT_27576 [Botryobasidium botryosum FD-172 SS1]